jgi:hypothetical protein
VKPRLNGIFFLMIDYLVFIATEAVKTKKTMQSVLKAEQCCSSHPNQYGSCRLYFAPCTLDKKQYRFSNQFCSEFSSGTNIFLN